MVFSLAQALDTHLFESTHSSGHGEYGVCKKCSRRFLMDHAGQIIAVDKAGNPLGEPTNTRWVYDPCPGRPVDDEFVEVTSQS